MFPQAADCRSCDHRKYLHFFKILIFQLNTPGLKIICLPSVRLTRVCEQNQALTERKLRVYFVYVKAYLGGGVWLMI